MTERYFLTYRGVTLPLQLSEELDAAALHNRNTYFCATYDAQGRVSRIEKRVYGEVELQHDYTWSDDGRLLRARVQLGDDEAQERVFG